MQTPRRLSFRARRVLPALALLAAGSAPLAADALPLSTGFENIAPGTSASPPAVVTADGIDLQLNPLTLPGGGFTSNFAEVQLRTFIPPASGFGDGDNELELNNVFAAFDFGGTPTFIQFDYAFLGGVTNLQVNGAVDSANGGLSGILGVALGAAVATVNGSYNGVDFELTGQTIGGANEIGTLRLGNGVDPINAFGVGGQELAIDSVRAVPEPTGAAILGTLGLTLCRRRRG